MPKEGIERLIAAATVNKIVRNGLLRGLAVDAIKFTEMVIVKEMLDITKEEIKTLASIKASSLKEYVKVCEYLGLFDDPQPPQK